MPTQTNKNDNLEKARNQLYQIIERCEQEIQNGDVQSADTTIKYLKERYPNNEI